MQLPKLYLRGSLVNQTMKNLSPTQKQELDQLLEKHLANIKLSSCREKFCQILANTIGGDYKQKEAALIDYQIALTRAIIYLYYHKPNHQITNSEIQLNKMLKQFIYNYMKQILSENKIIYSSNKTIETVNLSKTLIEKIKTILNKTNNQHLTINTKDNTNITYTNKLNKEIENKINKLTTIPSIIEINQSKNQITIKNTDKTINIEVKTKVRARSTSIFDEDNKLRQDIGKISTTYNYKSEFILILPKNLKELYEKISKLEIYTIKEISEELNLTITETQNIIQKIKKYYIYYISGEKSITY